MKKPINKKYIRWGVGVLLMLAIMAAGCLLIAKLVDIGIIKESFIAALTVAVIAIAVFVSSHVLCKGDIKTALIYTGILCGIKICIFMIAGDINSVGVYDIAGVCATAIAGAAGGIKFSQKKKGKKRAKYTKK